MVTTGARIVLRHARGSNTSVIRPWTTLGYNRNSGCLLSSRPRLLPAQHLQQLQQQRRPYVFWPSDLSELSYRWKLWWDASSKTPTKIRVRLRQGYEAERTRFLDGYQVQKALLKKRYHQHAAKLKQRYQAQAIQLKDGYRNEKFRLATKYRQQKASLQLRYKLQLERFQRRYQGTKIEYGVFLNRGRLGLANVKARMKQKRGEFVKRWTARRKVMVEDGKNYFRRYMTKSVPVTRPRFDLAGANARLTQKRREFVKRWTARRRDMMEDGKNYVRHYRTRTFTVTEYCEPNWFDPTDGRPLTSRDPTGRFVNPWLSWSTNGVHSITNILKWRYQRGVRQWKERGLLSFLPKDLKQLIFGSLLSVESKEATKGTSIAPSAQANPTDIEFTWIGHSTCLVRMGNATILTDPIFSHRCSPFPRLPGVGVAREVPPSMTIQELPSTIDVCLISHDHYDHMDQVTISHLRDKVKHWVLPKGLPHWLETRCSVDPETMTELEWWQSVHFAQHQDGKWKIVPGPAHATDDYNETNTMTITCCPAQHWSSRTFFDRCKRLWCGFAVETRTTITSTTHTPTPPVTQKFFFAGDTGMPRNGFPLFHQIGEFCGRGLCHQHHTEALTSIETPPEKARPLPPFHPIDLAAIPIGAYDPSFLMQEAHLNPEEAVQCARQLQARKAVAIHWGTFALSEEPMEEPPEKLVEALQLPENRGVDFVHLPIGGSMRVPAFG